MDAGYEAVDKHDRYDNENNEDAIPKWKPLFRQVFVISAAWMLYFLCGLSFGAPTVLIPQLRREANSTAAVSDEMASWLLSVFGYSALPWVFILSFLTKHIGRKIPFALVCLNTLAYYIVLYYSTNTTHILISEIMQGMNYASNMTLSIIIVTEYASPKYRGIFLAIKSATIFWGIWVANAIGTYFHWKNIPLVGILLSFYSLTVLFWPESPQWLASKGRFEECEKSFIWLRCSKKTDEELQKLIGSQIQCLKNRKDETLRECFTNLKLTVKSKAFYMPVILSMVMMMQYQLTGKVVCMVYALEIIKRITNNENTAYTGMLILDGVTVFGMYMGCVISRFVKRRTLLLTTGVIGVFFLFLVSIYLYLIKLSVISENGFVTIAFLISFSISISCGPMILATSIYGELTPLRYKTSCMIIAALTFVTLLSTLLKLSLYIFKSFGMHGTFLFYAISSSLCLLVLYKFLPETKDKTLQEIEDYFKEAPKSAHNGELIASAFA